jgi:hypothetical protein
MRKKYKVGMMLIAILIILVSMIGISKIFLKKDTESKPKVETKIISNIEKYGYTLDDRDTKYMKETFKELESILNIDEINKEEYAKVLSKLFIIDFYTLSNKINKYDVGSLEYILNDKVEIFKNKAMDTIYSDIIDNTYKDRVQELPEITDVEILEIKKSKFELNKEEKESYKITLKFSYKKDLGYDKEGTLHIIENNNKLEVALYNPKIEK